MRSVESLLTEAVEKCHGQAELARRLGTSSAAITHMKNGERAISPETVALLCDVLELPGEETQRLVALAIIGAAKNASKREKLKRAFFGCWVAGVVGASLQLSPTPSNAESTDVPTTQRVSQGLHGYTLSRI
jgi:transcriptional regulator with XRE-family HTH domain